MKDYYFYFCRVLDKLENRLAIIAKKFFYLLLRKLEGYWKMILTQKKKNEEYINDIYKCDLWNEYLNVT